MSAAAKVPVRMTVAEFLNWDSSDDLKYELVDGEPRAMSPARRTHGMLQSELARVIGNHLLAQGRPCDVVTDPGVIPRILPDYNMRIPDLGVTCTPYEAEESALSEPVLLIEILSPSNQSKTWTNVWAYTSIPSVREILILRSDRIAAELLRRGTEGEWPERPLAVNANDGLILESIGFRVPLAELYARTRLRAG